MTTMEKVAQNFLYINIARLAMLITPIMIGWFWSMAMVAWENQDKRIAAVEKRQQEQHDQLNELNFRAASGRSAREALTVETKTQFAAVNDKLDALSGAVIRLQTIIETRLPAREGKLGNP